MLPVRNRLRRPEDFSAAMRAGRRAGRPSLVLHLVEPALENGSVDHGSAGFGGTDPVPPALVGMIVSRQVGGAVVRNQVKRRLRHLMARRLGRLAPGSLVVVRANPAAAGAAVGTLAEDLDAGLARLVGRSGPRQSSGGRR